MSYQRWTRPDSVPFPSVWSRFDGCKQINGITPKFWVQDIPDDHIEDAISFMQGFLRDEPLNKFSNILEDQDSIEGYRSLCRSVLRDKLGLICYMENPDPNGKPIIAGVNCTYVECKGGSEFNVVGITGARIRKILSCLEYVGKKKDFYKEIKSDSYLGAIGLYVSPDFRGQGIGLELLKARKPLCRAVGIKASITAFTAIGSQTLAKRVGFKDLVVISYEDLRKEKPEYKFPGIEEHTETLKYMYLPYN